MSTVEDPTLTPPKKYSRYRSVRQQAETTKTQPPGVPSQSSYDAGITRRSMSRYRRSRVVSKTDHSTPPPIPSIPTSRPSPGPETRETVRRVTDPVPRATKHQVPSRHDTIAVPRSQRRVQETETERLQRNVREIHEQESQHRGAQRAIEGQELVNARLKGEQARLTTKEKERLLAEQKRKDLERLEAELEAAAPPLPRVTSPGKEKDRFNFFSKKRSGTRNTPPHTAGNGKSSLSASRSRSSDSVPIPPHGSTRTSFRVIEQKREAIVPGIDAPMSAVNAGERRVLIRYKQSSINLPITPETTPVDLAYSAASIMARSITPSSAILIESYTQLGLERRVRRYEHIRDIINSWDRDTQNALIIQNSDSPNYDHDLEPYSVPREAPKDVSVYMYHSQKSGKWNKRHITLLSNGQIFMSKKSGGKVSDKDITTLCHLTDFDIYTVTPQQSRRTLKPPKKHCYAIKSQQKTNMFLSIENFVHFFSTDDQMLAERWYNAVQRWRSWYLVNRMGEGGKAAKKKSMADVTTSEHLRSGTKAGPSQSVKVSVDEDPYTIGFFKPLVNLDRFSPPPDPDCDPEEEDRPRHIPFHLRNSVSPVLPASRRESKRHPPPVAYKLPPEVEDEFNSSGLLGRTYSQRQRGIREREAASKQRGNPFVDGPSQLNSGELQRPVTAAGPGLQRGGSKREKPKPLLDFTPQFKEPPQWDKTGKGHGVPAPSGVPLVEVATTPADPLALDLPKATVLRRDTRPATSTGPAGKRDEDAFIKGGLVSGSGGGANKGRANA